MILSLSSFNSVSSYSSWDTSRILSLLFVCFEQFFHHNQNFKFHIKLWDLLSACDHLTLYRAVLFVVRFCLLSFPFLESSASCLLHCAYYLFHKTFNNSSWRKQSSSTIQKLICWATGTELDWWLAHCTLFYHPWPMSSVALVGWSCSVSKVAKVSD